MGQSRQQHVRRRFRPGHVLRAEGSIDKGFVQLDRITRKGAEDALRLIRQFRERGCTIVSIQEPWLNGSPEIWVEAEAALMATTS